MWPSGGNGRWLDEKDTHMQTTHLELLHNSGTSDRESEALTIAPTPPGCVCSRV